MRRPPSGLFLLALLASLAAPAARSQPADLFGSSDDPREIRRLTWWRPEQRLDVLGGLSLIAAQWRSAAHASADVQAPPLLLRLEGTVRTGIYGTYRPDVDDAYDALRLLAYARLVAPPGSPWYLRAGPLTRTRLGTGHLVDFFSSTAAWDDRTIGLEAMWRSPAAEVAAFSDDVRFDGVMGGRVALAPLFWHRRLPLRTLRLGVSAVTDRASLPAAFRRPTAYALDLGFDAFRSGVIYLSPFAGVGWLDRGGYGLHFGADLHSDNFIDLARFRFRLAIEYNSARFRPGLFGAFYMVDNPGAAIVGDVEEGDERPAGIPLDRVRAGNDLVTEFRLLLFDRFELWYQFRRHYGQEALSSYHLRLFLHTNRFRLSLGEDRAGLTSFFTLFSRLGNQSTLDFRTEYRLFFNVWVHLRARYAYERVGNLPDGRRAYLVQRRFEPFTGLRFRF